MRVTYDELKELMARKLEKAGLQPAHAEVVADVLAHADARGIHSHGAMRTEYYAERIAKGGITVNPDFRFTKTTPGTAVLDADNGAGHVAAKEAMDHAIGMARENGTAIVGIRRMSHSGAMSYFVQQAAEAGMIGISLCQSDPMVVPFGGAEPYFGTNPIGFAAPGTGDDKIIFDMATSVQAWGKILHARSKGESIPDTWAVDADGVPTTDPFKVTGLLPIAGPKGYGLMMMVDILSGVLLGLPFGKHVSSMYHDLTAGRELGQLHIVIDPGAFTSAELFRQNISGMMKELNEVKPAPGFDRVLYPGQNTTLQEKESMENGIEIVDDILAYLRSDTVHNNQYDHKDPFAK